jgi:lactate permease
MRTLLAALPIALLLVLLLAVRMPAAKAAWLALAAALAVAVAPFRWPAPSGAGLASNLAGVLAEGAFIAATILWILLPALAMHELQVRSGAFAVLRDALSRAAPDSGSRVLLIGWFFALFMEGAAGFGTPLAVAAPMLVALGVAPVPAVAAALIGHTAGVAFGAVGTPIIALTELAEVSAGLLSINTAILLLPIVWIPLVFVLRASAPDTGAHFPGGSFRPAVYASVLFYVPFAASAIWIGPELPTLAGALVGGMAYVAHVRSRGGARPSPGHGRHLALLRSAAPYLVLIALILATRLADSIQRPAMALRWEWQLPGGYTGSIQPLYHPGTLLFVALIAGAVKHRASIRLLAECLSSAARRLAPAVLALVAMLALSRLMLHSGMISQLARSAERGVGEAWPVVAPLVGALGSFVTGSATSSNVLFGSLQEQAATNLRLDVAVVLAAQTVGAAVGNAICPHNVIAGAAAVGAAGREGEIMRRTLPACFAMLATTGAVALVLVRL